MHVPLDGRLLVEASAGTGKTHAITTLILRLLLEQRLGIEQILAMTFTEAATADLRDRVRTRLVRALAVFEGSQDAAAADPELLELLDRSKDRDRDRGLLTVALQRVDEVAVFTIHGFCHRMLQLSAFDSGLAFDAELLRDTLPLRSQAVQDHWTRETAAESPLLVRVLSQHGALPSDCAALADIVARCPDLRLLTPVPPDSVRLDVRGFFEALREARMCWDRARVQDALLRHPGLNRNRYKTTSISAWCDRMELLFGATPAAPELFPSFDKFCPHMLRAALKSGHREPPRDSFFDACARVWLEHESFQRNAEQVVIGYKHRLAQRLRVELPAARQRAGLVAFDDMLLQLRHALQGAAGDGLAEAIRRRFPVALVDEFQDTDPLQWAIFDRVWRPGTLMLIGDPKQAIYSFRGADVFTYLAAARRLPMERRFTMGVNWRSDARLVRAVSALFARSAQPMLLSAIAFPEVRAAGEELGQPRQTFRPATDDAQAPLEILFVRRDKKSPRAEKSTVLLVRAIASEISTLLSSGASIGSRALQAGDIAVLSRSNKQAFDMQCALREVGVASVVLGDQSVFSEQRSEARELQLVLSAVAEPSSDAAVRAALCTELIGLSANVLALMRQDVPLAEGGGWQSWVQRFRYWHAVWTRRGFVQMFRALSTELEIEQRLLAMPDGERRVTNLRHLVELLHGAASTEHLGPAGLLHWLSTQRSAATTSNEASQLRLESDEQAVRLTTIHKSKGLEYPVVFCPFLWDGTLLKKGEQHQLLFHDPANQALSLQLLSGNEDKDRLAAMPAYRQLRRERLAESLRLLYVALTRARHRCFVVWGALRNHHSSALGYLLHGRASSPLEELSVEQLKAQLGALDDEQRLADIAQLVADSDGAVGLRELDLHQRQPLLPQQAEGHAALSCKQVARLIDRSWTVSSFSQLAAAVGPTEQSGASRSGANLREDESNRSEPSGADANSIDHSDGRDRDQHGTTATISLAHAGEPVTLLRFPRGAKAGNFFHDLFEHLDFTAGAEARAQLVGQKLRAHGYGVDEYRAIVCQALEEQLTTKLKSGRYGFCLRDIQPEQRLDELGFHVPIAAAHRRSAQPIGRQLELCFGPPADAAEGLLTRRELAAVFADHPSEALRPDYADRVARLGFSPLRGFLKGFIDLVFCQRGRWYLADYKSNHLGDVLSSYDEQQLTEAMAHSHYYLQYHLYVLALHRHLAARVRGYRYEKHFGGVFYLFIKGMRPPGGSAADGNGVFFERPPRRRIEALSALLDHPSRPPARSRPRRAGR